MVDEPGTWEMTVSLTSGKRGAPKEACTVDITPRRLQKLQVKPGMKFTWTSTSVKDGETVQRGSAEADKHGLVTMKKVTVTQGGNRIRLTPAG